MKKNLLIALIFTALSTAFAEGVLYQSKFDKLKPAENLFKANNDSRERQSLFPDAKPSLNVSLQARKNRFNGFVSAVGTKIGELKLVPVPDKKFPLKRKGELLLALTRAKKNLTIQMSLRTENFLKKKTQNYFFVYAGGANIWFRGDSKDIRYYDAEKKSYKSIMKLEENKKYELKITLHFGEKSLFDLSINGKELLKGKVQRGAPNALKTIKIVFAAEQKSVFASVPAIYLQNIKVFNN